MPYPPPESNLFFYHSVKWLVVSPALHLFCGIRTYGLEHLPTKGPFLAVANHASNFDPLIIANCLGQPAAFMAKEELFRIPLLGDAIRMSGAFPVKRGQADRAALRSSLEALDAGWIVGLFIQGTRTYDGKVTNPQPGAALLAAKTQVPLLPVAIWGSTSLLAKGKILPHPTPVTVRFGALIPPPTSSKREALEATSQQCADVINGLLAQGR
jgi:1-acyl-sn-glycerol-3-phosphate acyltransferase